MYRTRSAGFGRAAAAALMSGALILLLTAMPGAAQEDAVRQKQKTDSTKQTAEKGQKTYTGRVVRIDGQTVVFTDAKGKEFSRRLSEDATISIDGRQADIDQFEQGDRIRLTFSRDDPNLIGSIQSVPRGSFSDRPRREQVNIKVNGKEAESGRALRVSELEGMEVRNRAGEDLGNIEDLMIDVSTGQVRFVVLSFGGFLSVGEKLFAVPWGALELAHEQEDPDELLMVLDVPKDRLEQAPGFDDDNWPATADKDYWMNVNTFYGTGQEKKPVRNE